jgi:hypothetical protein
MSKDVSQYNFKIFKGSQSMIECKVVTIAIKLLPHLLQMKLFDATNQTFPTKTKIV